MNPQILHDYIIFPTLQQLGGSYQSQAARQLILATSAQESRCGDYLKQMGNGPALGLYQMEPATANDLIDGWLKPTKRWDTVKQFASQAGMDQPYLISMVGELFYATAMARMKYFRASGPLPAYNDFEGMWAYYKKWWNSTLGAATKDQFKAAWDKYVVPTDFSDPTGRIKPFAKTV